MSNYFKSVNFRDIKQGIFFDIEAATVVKELKEKTDLYESWKYKMRNEGLETFEQYDDEFKKSGPLYSPFARICCISSGYCTLENKLKVKEYKGEDEKVILTEFFQDLGKLVNNGRTHLISFAGLGYDMPVIAFRALVNGVEVHPTFDVFHQKEWNLKHCIDLNLYLRGTAFTNISLINAAVAFGLPSPKQSMSGDEVSNIYWGKGKDRIEKIGNYCSQDVLTTANILCKIMNQPILELEIVK